MHYPCVCLHLSLAVHVFYCLLASVLALSWYGKGWLTQRKQLTAPRPCLVLAGLGGECLGASRIATNRALSPPWITVISSGSRPACSATHTLTLAYACMVCLQAETMCREQIARQLSQMSRNTQNKDANEYRCYIQESLS